MYPNPFAQVIQQTSYQPKPMNQPVLQLPTHPAHQQKHQTESNPAQNNQYQYPPVDANLLNQSANETKKIMADASMVLDKFATSKEFG